MLERLTINLPRHVVERLQLRAINEGRSVSNLAAFILEANLDQSVADVGEQAQDRSD